MIDLPPPPANPTWGEFIAADRGTKWRHVYYWYRDAGKWRMQSRVLWFYPAIGRWIPDIKKAKLKAARSIPNCTILAVRDDRIIASWATGMLSLIALKPEDLPAHEPHPKRGQSWTNHKYGVPPC